MSSSYGLSIKCPKKGTDALFARRREISFPTALLSARVAPQDNSCVSDVFGQVFLQPIWRKNPHGRNLSEEREKSPIRGSDVLALCPLSPVDEADVKQ